MTAFNEASVAPRKAEPGGKRQELLTDDRTLRQFSFVTKRCELERMGN